jgi:hypothetical protein
MRTHVKSQNDVIQIALIKNFVSAQSIVLELFLSKTLPGFSFINYRPSIFILRVLQMFCPPTKPNKRQWYDA